jgi:hypothetical protein
VRRYALAVLCAVVGVAGRAGMASPCCTSTGPARALRLQPVLDPRTGPVAGDPERLRQVVWNLLSNAVKFTPRGGRVQARLARVNSHVEIVVSDTGQGISAELLPLVFEHFRQGDSRSRRVHGGLGLGLALVKYLVELHGDVGGGRARGHGGRVEAPGHGGDGLWPCRRSHPGHLSGVSHARHQAVHARRAHRGRLVARATQRRRVTVAAR